jgi:regulator-associated protein of mTOR
MEEAPQFFTDMPRLEDVTDLDTDNWRAKDSRKLKTLSIGVILCLNIGVPPPNVVKTHPCAKLECWLDPSSMPPLKALEAISARLMDQYARWQPKVKCKELLDLTVEDVKKLCVALRRRAKDEPALLHYNGHGAPPPTDKGELWVFNKSFTQYLPIPLVELLNWMGSPSILVLDCSGAGVFSRIFDFYAAQNPGDAGGAAQTGGAGGAGQAGGGNFLRAASLIQEKVRNTILLAACDENESLPTNPDLPADLFTSCLTTPIETALRWVYTTRHQQLMPNITLEMLDKIPGQLNDRRTMRGQLNWIFTAVTDTIAWNLLPSDLFHRLFRNDLLVAALFRNFLLASRIMRSFSCTPLSFPKLPDTHAHVLWEVWDMSVDACLAQLPKVLSGEADFEHSPFFADQLTAFEVWLKMGCEGQCQPPQQLPVVLQVLLSQQHRLRALELLRQFLSLGSWAV